MRDRLFIEEQEVELQPDTVIAITLQINDFSEMTDRQANYTNQFKVPRTRRNREIFGLMDTVQSETGVPYKKLNARVIKEGITVVQNGFAIVESSTDTYNVTVYGGLIDFFKLIEGKKLADLDLSQYNHLWTHTNVVASRNNNDGYIYAIIDNGQVGQQIVNTDKNIESKFALPSFFVHTIIQKIVQSVGFVLSGEILNSTVYQNLILQLANDKWVLAGKILNAEKTDDTTRFAYEPYGAVSNFFAQDDSSGDAILRTGNFDAQGAWFQSGGTLAHYFILQDDYEVPSQLELKFSGRYSWWWGIPNPPLTSVDLVVFKLANGTGPSIFLNSVQLPIGFSQGETNQPFEISLPAGSYSDNDHIFLQAIRNGLPGYGSPIFVFHAGTKVEAWAKEPIDMTINDPVSIADNMPDISQTEFMKAVAQLFGLSFIPDPISGELNVKGLKVLYDNIPIAKDWSDKLHMDKDKNGLPVYDIRYRLGNYAQTNYFRYDNDDAVPEDYGSGTLTVNDKTLDSENEAVRVPFGASLMTKPFVSSVDKYVPAVRRWDASGKCSISVNPRVFILNRQATNPENVAWKSYTGTVTTIPDNVPYCRFIHPNFSSNLGFNSSLLSDWYQLLANILDRSNVLNVLMKLTPVDVNELDHFIPIYLHQFNAYFYINKVSNYVGANKLTKVELIRIGTGVVQDSATLTLSDELIVNNSFDNGMTDWNGDDWDITGGKASHTAGTARNPLTQTFAGGSLTIGAKYRLEVTVVDMQPNGTGQPNYVDVYIGATFVLTFMSNGTEVTEFTSNGESFISFVPTEEFNGSIAFVSLKEIL